VQYQELLRNSGIGLPATRPEAEPVWHLFVVTVSDRDRVHQRLKDSGIETGVHYPIPLHLQPAYHHLGFSSGTLPITEFAAQHVLSLPMYAELTEGQIASVSQSLRKAIGA